MCVSIFFLFHNFNLAFKSPKKILARGSKTRIMDRLVYAHLKASAAGITAYAIASNTHGVAGYLVAAGALLATDPALRLTVRTAGALLRNYLVPPKQDSSIHRPTRKMKRPVKRDG
jgi:hypothetical protein